MSDRPSTSMIAKLCTEAIATTLPPRWDLSLGDNGAKLSLASDGKSSEFSILTCRSTKPSELINLAEEFSTKSGASFEHLIVLADFLSPRSRALLNDRQINWIDTTGNVRIVSSSPGLYLERQGSQNDPWPQDSSLRTLKGAGAERAMRALLSTTPPFGIRELALRCQVSAATLSRVVDLLEREAMLTRSQTGGVASINWREAILRWSEDVRSVRTRAALTCIEPRGLQVLERNLAASSFPFAATGSLAAKHLAPVAPLRTAAIYTPDPLLLSRELGLQRVERGANVMLLESDELPVRGCVQGPSGIVLASISQIAVDLLSGSGREPAEGEAILDWMEEHQDEWRN